MISNLHVYPNFPYLQFYQTLKVTDESENKTRKTLDSTLQSTAKLSGYWNPSC